MVTKTLEGFQKEENEKKSKQMSEYIRDQAGSNQIGVRPMKVRPNENENKALRAKIAAKQRRATIGGN